MNLKAQQQAFANHIRTGEPGKLWSIPAERMAVYRRLFWGNIEGYLSRTLAKTATCLGPENWQNVLHRFFAEASMTSPIYRDLPAEFITWAAPQPWPGFPAWWLELAHFEALQTALYFAPDTTPQTWLQPCAVGSYTHPVQQWQDGQLLTPQQTFLLVFRATDDKVKYLPVDAAQAHFIELAHAHPNQPITAIPHQQANLTHLRQQGVITAQ